MSASEAARSHVPTPDRGRLARLLGVIRELPPIAGVIVLATLVLAVFGTTLAPHSTIEPNLRDAGLPPGSGPYLLGTDQLGRDILSRLIVGSRVSIQVAVLGILIGGAIGTALGLLAGHYRGWLDALLMRAVDIMFAFPVILLALVLSIVVGPSFWTVVGVLATATWARYARLVRGQVLSWRERDFISLAQISGASSFRIMRLHLIPNVLDSVVVLSTLQLGNMIIAEASLSFLGVGIPPPTPTWGGMVSDGQAYLESAWWIATFPGIMIVLVVISFNTMGDWLRDKLDPKLRQL